MQKFSQLSKVLAVGGLAIASPALAAAPKAAVPLTSPGEWVRSSDYPAYALRNGAEGDTAFRLTVDTNGRVSRCEIVVGSGSEVLDEATCRLLTERARFAPATDRLRRPVIGTYRSRIRWRIPADRENPRTGEIVYSHLVSADGNYLECRIERTSGQISETPGVGPVPCPTAGLQQIYRDAAGKPVGKRIRYTFRTEVVDVEPAELAAAEKRALSTTRAAVAEAAKTATEQADKAASTAPPPAPTKP
jgi:TonB family protein